MRLVTMTATMLTTMKLRIQWLILVWAGARSSLVDDEAACSGSGSDSGGVDNSEFIGSIVEALAD